MYTLIIMFVLTSGVSMNSVNGFHTKAGCEAAGKETKKLSSNIRFACVHRE